MEHKKIEELAHKIGRFSAMRNPDGTWDGMDTNIGDLQKYITEELVAFRKDVLQDCFNRFELEFGEDPCQDCEKRSVTCWEQFKKKKLGGK